MLLKELVPVGKQQPEPKGEEVYYYEIISDQQQYRFGQRFGYQHQLADLY